jgi:hypothetical protein
MDAEAGRLPDDQDARRFMSAQHRARSQRQIGLACATTAHRGQQGVERTIGSSG